MAKRQTRAVLGGISVAKQRRRIERMANRTRQEFQQLAYDFADVDNAVVGIVDDFLRGLDVLEKAMQDELKYLDEVPGDD